MLWQYKNQSNHDSYPSVAMEISQRNYSFCGAFTFAHVRTSFRQIQVVKLIILQKQHGFNVSGGLEKVNTLPEKSRGG
jgi:hypothetical protein